MAVPYTFGTATAAIPLSQLDSNFATAITLGNTAVYLGNTTTSIGNLTLTNVTISSGSVTITDTTVSGNVTLSGGTANGVAYLNGSKVLTTGSALTFDGTNFATTGNIDSGAGKNIALNATSSGDTTRLQWKYQGTAYAWIERVNSNGDMAFGVQSSEQMRLTNTGLAIGTTTTNVPLGFAASISTAGSANKIRMYDAGAARYGFGVSSSQLDYVTGGAHVFYIGGNAPTEAARIDSSGNLGLGVTPSAWQSSGNMDFSGGAAIGLGTSSSALTLNAYFNGGWKYKTTNYASYYYQVSGQHQWFNAPSGTAGNAITFTQAMTLDASGRLLVGTTDAAPRNFTSGSGFRIGDGNFEAAFASGNYILNITSASGTIIEFRRQGPNAVGTISTNGTVTLYNTTSDQRLKENIVDADSASSLIDSLKVRQFDWKTDNSHQRYGFVAQELVTVAPEAVHQPEDTEQMMAVDYSKLVPMLVKEIQSLRKRLTALEGKA